MCIARRGSGVSESFTVRKISNGVGVERIFPMHSPMIADIAIVRRGRVRRAKLYYLRQLTGKATRIKEKKVRVVVPTTGTAEEKSKQSAAARHLELKIGRKRSILIVRGRTGSTELVRLSVASRGAAGLVKSGKKSKSE